MESVEGWVDIAGNPLAQVDEIWQQAGRIIKPEFIFLAADVVPQPNSSFRQTFATRMVQGNTLLIETLDYV